MTKRVKIGSLAVGGGESVKIQSMTTIKTSDVENNVAQILRLQEAGCDIVRVSVLDEADALAIKEIKKRISIPLVADIHFSASLAVKSIESGADKIRINPGNIGGEDKVALVAAAIKANGVAVRVGSNTGSIEPEYFRKYGRSERALVESALSNVSLLEKHGVYDIVISVKASDVPLTVRSYTLLSRNTDYPLHLGVTEAGTAEMGIVKSAVGIGSLLLNGIGDTIRVSLTDDPVKEIYAAKNLLRACGLDKNYAEVVSCPTCGRCSWNSMALAEKVNAYVRNVKKPVKIAVMGCVVNGPGEAREADLGIAGGKGECVIFKKGEVFKKVKMSDAEEEFFRELKELLS